MTPSVIKQATLMGKSRLLKITQTSSYSGPTLASQAHIIHNLSTSMNLTGLLHTDIALE